jgi:hypothetical protein
LLPRFSYYLDEADPDILILRRQDGSFVAAFSAQGATKESIREAAEADYVAITQEVAHARVVRCTTAAEPVHPANFPEFRTGEVRRTPLLRASVNRGKTVGPEHYARPFIKNLGPNGPWP